ncbi:MAG: hypothetical protein ACP5LX_00825 [Nitrososphaeria archaeon]
MAKVTFLNMWIAPLWRTSIRALPIYSGITVWSPPYKGVFIAFCT